MAVKSGNSQPAAVTATAPVDTGSGSLADMFSGAESVGADEAESNVSEENAKSWESTEDSPDELDSLFNQEESSDQTEEDPSESTEDQSDVESENSQADKAVDKKASDEEVITITDGDGKKQIKINYSDRAAIKRAFELAHGSRKWQADRDRKDAELKKLTEETKGDRQMVGALEKAWEEGGESAVLDLIAGRQGAHKAWLDKEIAKRQLYEKGKPEEIAAYEQKERVERLEREMARRDAREKAREAQLKQEREAADVAKLEGTMHPIYEKYRFDGKLGNAEDEEFFDDILWNETVKRLKPFEDQGVQLTRELVNREMNAVAQRLRSRINAQAEKKAAKAVQQTKDSATASAQSATMSAYKGNSVSKEASDLIGKGDLKSLFGNWGKYSKAFKK